MVISNQAFQSAVVKIFLCDQKRKKKKRLEES